METAVSEKPVRSAKLTRLRNELAAAEARLEEARKVLAVTLDDAPLMARIGAAVDAEADAKAAEDARSVEENDLDARLLKAVGLVRLPENMRSWRAAAWDPEQSPALH